MILLFCATIAALVCLYTVALHYICASMEGKTHSDKPKILLMRRNITIMILFNWPPAALNPFHYTNSIIEPCGILQRSLNR
jgi:hypothetical protein